MNNSCSVKDNRKGNFHTIGLVAFNLVASACEEWLLWLQVSAMLPSGAWVLHLSFTFSK